MVTVKVASDSEIARGLREAEQSGESLRVDTGDAVYTVWPRRPHVPGLEPGFVWKHHDPERVREGLRRSAGALAGVDTEQLRADLREQRAQNSAGRPG